MKAIKQRLEELRTELRAERISQGELAELQSLVSHIDKGDVELLEAAGVPEFPEPLKTGMYVLDHPVKNPKPDRRRCGWENQAEFPAGTYKVVVEETSKYSGVKIGLRGKLGDVHNRHDSERFAALSVALKPKENLTVGDIYDLFAPFPCKGLVLALLVKRGFLTLEHVRIALHDLDNMTEQEVDALSTESGM